MGLAFSVMSIFALMELRRFIGGSNLALALAFGMLASSESFVSFSTSGLENSLTFFLVICIIRLSLDSSRRRLFYLASAMAVINRFDVVFVIFPICLAVMFSDFKRREIVIKDVLIGSIPFFAWHIFSIVYYGFFFPNTKYAKVGGRPISDNVISGFNYLIDSVMAELFLVPTLTTLIVAALLIIRSPEKSISRNKYVSFAILAGIILQLIYIIFVSGGDFMRGRFLAIIVLFGAISVIFLRFDLLVKGNGVGIGFFLAAAPVLFISALVGAKEVFTPVAKGVSNERNYYKNTLALNLNPEGNFVSNPWAQSAREIKAEYGVVGVNGQRAYWVPRDIKLIDPVALTDAFIARQPITDSSRTGHFQHDIPSEYIEIKTGNMVPGAWRDARAEFLYKNIVEVTESKDLFTMARFRSMCWLWRNYGF